MTQPKPVGRPRLCVGDIEWIRELRSDGLSYSWIAYKTGYSKKTCQRYCTGKWKDYDITVSE